MLVVVATLPLLAIVVIVQTRLILNYVNEESENFANANRAASEAFTAIKTVAAFGMEEQLAGMYKRLLAAPTAKAKKRIVSSAVGFGCNQVIIFGIFFGYIFFDELPTINMIIGALFIIFSGLFVIQRERKLGKTK